MKQSIADQLREHLSSITKEQFAAEWAQIKALNLGGPSVDVFLCSWEALDSQIIPIEKLPERRPRNITIPKKLTPDYRSLSFFTNLAA